MVQTGDQATAPLLVFLAKFQNRDRCIVYLIYKEKKLLQCNE